MVSIHDVERIASEAFATGIFSARIRRIGAEPYTTSMVQDGVRATLVIADDDCLPNDGSTLLDTLVDLSDRRLAAGDERLATLNTITEDELAHLGDPDV